MLPSFESFANIGGEDDTDTEEEVKDAPIDSEKISVEDVQERSPMKIKFSKKYIDEGSGDSMIDITGIKGGNTIEIGSLRKITEGADGEPVSDSEYEFIDSTNNPLDDPAEYVFGGTVNEAKKNMRKYLEKISGSG